MKTCSHCGKTFSRGYNLRRHLDNSCPMLTNSEEEKSSESPEYDYEHEDIDDEDMEEESQSDGNMSDDGEDEDADDDDDDDGEDVSDTDSEDNDIEESVWNPIIEESKALHRQDYEELVQKFLNDGLEEETARNKAYHRILPELQKEARYIYLEKLKWMREMRKDPINRKVMETKESFMYEDGFDGEEALEAAVKKRKFLLNRIFEDDVGFEDSGEENNDEDNY